jgi:2-keto-3-deoxy-L-rhamnonate aldolase RhmA
MSTFRQLLKAAGGHPPIGTWIMSASPLVAEAVGCAGFDWGVVDMEHSPLDLADVVALLQALGNTRMVPLVRVPWNDPVVVKRVLDAGAATLVFPMIDDAEAAARAVASTRYPPQGTRGMAGMSRAARFGTAPNYLVNANKHVGVVLQLETARALERLPSIAAVDGVDALFIGPADLSASMGHVGQFMHAAVLDRMSHAVQQAQDAGKPIGTLGGTPEQVAQYRAMGFDFVALSSDLGLLMHGAQVALASLRTQEIAHVHSLTGGTRPAETGY